MFPEHLAVKLEGLIAAELPGPLKCFVGAYLAMFHGVLRWSDFQRSVNLRFGPDGVTAQDAAKFTLHSLRRTYPTLMKQLKLSSEDVEDAGHWARGSEMVRKYDAELTVGELRAKAGSGRGCTGVAFGSAWDFTSGVRRVDLENGAVWKCSL
ncbi:unnamed protein product, partial [Prorocentrum cordatum]